MSGISGKTSTLHIYSIGDLDDFFWPHTLWFGTTGNENIQAIVLLYVGCAPPTLLALSNDTAAMRSLLESLRGLLPPRFYAHLSPGLDDVFFTDYEVDDRGEHYKMALRDKHLVTEQDPSCVSPLSLFDRDELLEFYAQSYPANWFDPRMLETGQYFGVRAGDLLVSVAGIHVYSPGFGVAALGNIATHPGYRNRGYARAATAGLCRSLLLEVEHIGANVKATNRAAIACYEQLGFEIVASYGEFLLTRTEFHRE